MIIWRTNVQYDQPKQNMQIYANPLFIIKIRNKYNKAYCKRNARDD